MTIIDDIMYDAINVGIEQGLADADLLLFATVYLQEALEFCMTENDEGRNTSWWNGDVEHKPKDDGL